MDTLTFVSFKSLTDSFHRALLAQNKAPKTILTYLQAVDELGRFLQEKGMPLDVSALRREHIEAFLVDLQTRPHRRTGRAIQHATVANRYRSLRQFFRWLLEEDEIKRSPMERLKPPHVPEKDVPVFTEEQLRRLLKTCEGKDFYSRRDLAILYLLLDTGMRRQEIGRLRIEDIDWDTQVVHVMGKGRRPRPCPFGRKTGLALDRYLRARIDYGRSQSGSLPDLWIGKRGRMGPDGITYVINQRTKQAGLPHTWPHMFRHTFAHRWLIEGGEEGDLMSLVGWPFPTVWRRAPRGREERGST